jgi:aryl-alcohol dehydrogenase
MPTATAAVLHDHHADLQLAEIEVDDPRPDEVLVRIVASGVCHSDISVREDVTPFPLPGVLGHEGAGFVEAIGRDVTDLAVGDPVVISFASCGHCLTCRHGHPVYCDTWAPLNLLGGTRADGSATLALDGTPLYGHFFGQSSFSTLSLARARNVVKVPEEAPLELLGPLACGMQTGAQAVVNILHPAADHTLVVFGAGAVGLSAVMAGANLTGATVVAVDVNPARLELAERLGASHTINALERDPVETVRGLTGGRGADHTLETSGVVSVLCQAVDSLGPLGTCGIIGAPRPDAEVALNVVNFIIKGIRLVGINQGDAVPRESIPALVRLYQQGRFPFNELVRFYDLADINHALADAAGGEVVKPIVRMPTQ